MIEYVNNIHVDAVQVVTCDVDAAAIAIATKHIQQSDYKNIINIRHMDGTTVINTLIQQKEQFDM
jgi:predicted O-methyltransferase YrrM